MDSTACRRLFSLGAFSHDDRCALSMWGSNFTGADQTQPGHTYAKAFALFWEHLGLLEEDRRWVMGETAAKLFHWADGSERAAL